MICALDLGRHCSLGRVTREMPCTTGDKSTLGSGLVGKVQKPPAACMAGIAGLSNRARSRFP